MKLKPVFLMVFILLVTVTANAGQRPLRYISIHGGGVAGLAPITILKKIEELAGQPISQLVDGVVGISSGAITASSICTGDSLGHPQFSSERFEANFINQAREILSLENLVWSKTDAALDKALQTEFGNAYMSRSLCHLMVVSYDRQKENEVIFDSVLAQDRQYDLPVWQAVRASSSIDFRFIGPLSSGTIKYNTSEAQGGFSDPGVHAHSDPTPFLAKRISELYPNREAVIYSLGTGSGRQDYTQIANVRVVHMEPNYEDVLGSHLGSLKYFVGVSCNTSPSNIEDVKKRAHALYSTAAFQEMVSDLTSSQALPERIAIQN